MPAPLVTFVITDLHRGGVPLLLAALLPALRDHFQNQIKFEVVSIARRGEIAGLLRTAGIKVLSLEARSNRDLAVVPRFAEYLRMRRPDLVFSFLVHANVMVALARPLANHPFTWIQSIHTVQEKPAWHWWAQGLVSGMADAIVAPSRAIIQKLQAYGPVPRPVVIPNGILISKFRDALPMSPVPWPDGEVVGYIGRFDPVKRLPLLIDAMKFLPDNFHLALIGYGIAEESLRSHVQIAGIGRGNEGATQGIRRGNERAKLVDRVHFIGATTSPERWYKVFDVFCLPSAAEGFPVAAVEAAVSGVPRLVVCGTPALRETLNNALWLPIDPTPQQVADKVRQGAEILQKSGKIATTEHRFDVELMVGRYGKIIGSLLPKALKYTNKD